MPDESPDNKPTKEISQTAVLNERLDKLQDIFESGIRNIRVDVGLVANDLTLVKGTIAIHEKRFEALEQTGSRRSDAVKQLDTRTSQNDLEQAAKIALLTEKTEALDAQVKKVGDIAGRLEKVASSIVGNRLVRRLAYAAGLAMLVAIGGWLASHGVHIDIPK